MDCVVCATEILSAKNVHTQKMAADGMGADRTVPRMPLPCLKNKSANLAELYLTSHTKQEKNPSSDARIVSILKCRSMVSLDYAKHLAQ